MKEHLLPERLASKIMMMKSHKSFLIVEGKRDTLLFEKFCADTCFVMDVGGKQNVYDTINELNERKFKFALAVRDSDFDVILKKKNPISNIYLSDYHDIEISIFGTKTLYSLVYHIGSKDKIDSHQTKREEKDILHFLLSTAETLSKIKLANIKYGLGLKFKPRNDKKPLDISKLFNKESLIPVDVDTMIDVIYSYSYGKSSGLKSRVEVRESYDKIRDEKYDLRHLCNGHDICAIIHLACQKIWGNNSKNDVTIEDIETKLIFGYDSIDFITTSLYSNIKKWEKKKGTPVLRC